MASESSRSSRTRGSTQKRGLLCGHGERPVLRISEMKDNPGRQFWGCVYYEVKEECQFFRWTDPEAETEDPQVARLKKKVVALKANVKASEWKLKVAAVLGMVGWVGCLFLWLQETLFITGWLKLDVPFSLATGGGCVELLMDFIFGLRWGVAADVVLGLDVCVVGLGMGWDDLDLVMGVVLVAGWGCDDDFLADWTSFSLW
ncbi:hypothetical protein Ahy_B09g098787 [Arachis hypogaea]|uniref:GRF-type domain-containing protein n=1 Tax=Arachis hypogaea TaxID=3818 RepID=A0A444XS22_ARAHY|nr:hypothetical protein Ahy_B09g098787 [Arachis hypogaea]